jgi:hypothetical protein
MGYQEMRGGDDPDRKWLTCPFDRSMSRTFESREATSIVSLGVVGERTMLVTGAVSCSSWFEYQPAITIGLRRAGDIVSNI